MTELVEQHAAKQEEQERDSGGDAREIADLQPVRDRKPADQYEKGGVGGDANSRDLCHRP